MNVYLKKILEKVDKTEKEDDKLLFCISYPKYVREILEHIAGTDSPSGSKPEKKETKKTRNAFPKRERRPEMILHVTEIEWPGGAPGNLPEKHDFETRCVLPEDELDEALYEKIDDAVSAELFKVYGFWPESFDWNPEE